MKRRFSNTNKNIEQFSRWFSNNVLKAFLPTEEKHDSVLYCTVELLNNAYEHGNGKDPTKVISVEWELKGDLLHLSIEDEGEGFNKQMPEEPPPLKEPRGRGLWSIKPEVSSIKFNNKGNKSFVTFKRSKMWKKQLTQVYLKAESSFSAH